MEIQFATFRNYTFWVLKAKKHGHTKISVPCPTYVRIRHAEDTLDACLSILREKKIYLISDIISKILIDVIYLENLK